MLRARAGARSRIAGLAPVALLPPAAFAVHQLRYMLAYGAGAGAELQRTGHSYLHSAVPWLVLALALVAGGFLRALGRAFSGQTSLPRYTLSFAGLWLACAAALVAIFACQEFMEGLLARGHPAGWVGIFGYGGWWAIPAAICIGLVLAAVLHGARWMLGEAARLGARARVDRGCAAPPARGPVEVLAAPMVPLVAGWSGRGPPGWPHSA
ncbi:MAG: hypothetical protein ACLPZR_28225 [Solirubrobacteraceae bacterium]